MAAINPRVPLVVPMSVPTRHTAHSASDARSRANTLTRFLLFLVLGFSIGTAIGWLLFPIKMQALLPVSHNTPQTRQYIIAVADKYWHTLDAVEAQMALRAYDPVELTGLMAVIMAESKSAETRAHVAALAQALDLMPPDAPFAVLLVQPWLILAVLVSLLPIVVAVWLVVLPAWRERRWERAHAEDALDAASTQSRGVPENGGADFVPARFDGDTLPDAAEGPNALALDPSRASPASGEGDDVTLPPLQPEASADELEEDAEEHASADPNILQDLANLFEEEDVSLSTLEALVKNLPEVAIDALVTRARTVVRQLQEWITTRPSAQSER